MRENTEVPLPQQWYRYKLEPIYYWELKINKFVTFLILKKEILSPDVPHTFTLNYSILYTHGKTACDSVQSLDSIKSKENFYYTVNK